MKIYSQFRTALIGAAVVLMALVVVHEGHAKCYVVGRGLLEEGLGYEKTQISDDYRTLNVLQATYFVAYITGVVDQSDELTAMSDVSGLFCGEIADVVLTYLKEHPELLETAANDLVKQAMLEEYDGAMD